MEGVPLSVSASWRDLIAPQRVVLDFSTPENTLSLLREAASHKMAIVVGALVGVCLPLLGKLLPKAAPYLPSAMGLGLSWVMVYSNCQAFAIGAVIVWIWTKLHARTADGYSVALASGFIAGESLIKAVIAMTATAIGLLAARM